MKYSKRIINILLILVFILTMVWPMGSYVFAGTITVGAGSYTDTLPSGQVGPPSTVYKTSNLTGGIPTNSWESSILWSQYSEAMYPHPLSVKFTANGLEVGRPQKSGEGTSAYTGRFVLWQHRVDMTIKILIIVVTQMHVRIR